MLELKNNTVLHFLRTVSEIYTGSTLQTPGKRRPKLNVAVQRNFKVLWMIKKGIKNSLVIMQTSDKEKLAHDTYIITVTTKSQ